MNIGLALNLHTHLEGWVRPATAAELAATAQVPEPPRGWACAMRVPGPGNLPTYLEHVAVVYPLLGSSDALTRVAHEAVIDAAADGCRFVELRVGPVTHTREDFPLDAAVEALCAGLEQGVHDGQIAAGLVMAALRHHPPEVNEELARLAVRHRSHGVVGFDLAGDEHNYPDLRAHRSAFAIAREGGLGITVHAAEAASANAAREAYELLGASRIGHGTRVAEDQRTLEWAAEAGLCFEVCPTSNMLTGAVRPGGDHPVKTFLDHGCDVVLGDDNPRQTGSPLSAEIIVLTEDLGLTAAELSAMSAAAVEHAFCPNEVRQQLSLLEGDAPSR